jgi:hypothetical protein
MHSKSRFPNRKPICAMLVATVESVRLFIVRVGL